MLAHALSFKDLSCLEDTALMHELKNSNHAALIVLMRRYKHFVINFAFRFLNDRERSKDVAQETFIRVFRFAHKYDEKGKFASWLMTIAANLAKTELRRGKQQHMEPLTRVYSNNNDYQVVEREVSDTRFMPDDSMDRELLQQHIQQALTKISPTNRQAVILRDLMQLSYEEISRVIGCELGTVKSRISRARQVLQRELRSTYQCFVQG